MCGINGLLALSGGIDARDLAELRRTRDAMASRGPDGAGEWIDAERGVALASRRLAILDLSEAGAQPMATADGRHHLVYNGEIYNFRELRRELEREGIRFRGHSDTEVLLAWLARHGAAGLRAVRGMYALALWDGVERSLLLARDPYGIKPLYYATGGGTLRFASQVKALEAGGGIPTAIDPAGLCGFLLWGSVPEPVTIRRGVRALPAGHLLWAREGEVGTPAPVQSFTDELEGDPGLELQPALSDSVAAHLVSDVPLGIFLSAGLDSALITALAARALPEPPVTLTLAFDEYAGTERDEAPLAAEVARALGTRHVERRIRRQDVQRLWPELLAAMDQPTIDGLNTFLVCSVAKAEGLEVALSGLGGDELFGSYPSFRDVPRWARWGRIGGAIPGAGAAWAGLARSLAPRRPKLAGMLRHARTLEGAYFLRRGLFLPEELPRLLPGDLLAEGLAGLGLLDDGGTVSSLGLARSDGDGWTAVHELESALYMRNQLLRDTDWASMSHSVEVRVPLVDPVLRAAAARGGFEPARTHGKAAVVRQAAPELPRALFARPKSGFTVPLAEWIEPFAGGGHHRPSDGGTARRLALHLARRWGADVDRRGSRSVGWQAHSPGLEPVAPSSPARDRLP